MYTVYTNITVIQVPTDDFPNRNLTITIPYLVSYNGKSSWDNLTASLSLVIPKNTKYKARDASGNIVSLGSINKSLGGYVYDGSSPLTAFLVNKPVPTFLRGDIITFNAGWRAKLNGKDGSEVTYLTGGPDPTGKYPANLINPSGTAGIPNLFQGFISKVSPRLPFTIECEDAMWLLKYVPTPTKCWGTVGDNTTLQQITQDILTQAYQPVDGKESFLARYQRLAGITLSVSKFSTANLVFNVRNFLTQRGTLAGMLARVKHQYKLDSYFRGYELRLGLTHYISSDCVVNDFVFQKNILDNDSLSFKRKDDTPLSVIVKAHYEVEGGRMTKDGQPAVKAQSTEILVFNNAGKFDYITKKKGVEFPPNEVGKRFTFSIYTPETNPEVLFHYGVRYLKKYYYDGLQGSFSTFAVPFVKHGDAVNITNPVLPEMDGMYMVKAVTPYGSVEEGGIFQTIELDFKISSIADIESYLL